MPTFTILTSATKAWNMWKKLAKSFIPIKMSFYPAKTELLLDFNFYLAKINLRKRCEANCTKVLDQMK
jgi:hypothetical protein